MRTRPYPRVKHYPDGSTLTDWTKPYTPAARKMIADYYRERRRNPETREADRMVRQLTRQMGRAAAKRWDDAVLGALAGDEELTISFT